jgi:hypothetical protein
VDVYKGYDYTTSNAIETYNMVCSFKHQQNSKTFSAYFKNLIRRACNRELLYDAPFSEKIVKTFSSPDICENVAAIL